MLRKVNRFLRMFVGRDAEDHGELVSVARQVLQRDAHLISGVEFQIEAKGRFGGCYSAVKIFTRVRRFQNRGIGGKESDSAPWTGDRHQVLSREHTAGSQDDAGKKTTVSPKCGS